ncbi:diaminopimelate epimerase [bacterium]|nr:diaminopimelate epimerase [bacterium]
MRFYKYHGTGNDFIVIELKNQNEIPSTDNIINWCKPHFGVGADGVLVILPSEKADYKMRIFNSDGSEAQMCGNGIRCVAFHIKKFMNFENSDIFIETNIGELLCSTKIVTENSNKILVSVKMGEAFFEAPELFVGNHINDSIDDLTFTSVSVGNPHMIFFLNEISTNIAINFGEKYGKNRVYLEGTNVETAKIIDEKSLELIVFERGCGLTMACGTGACATVAAGIKNGYLKSNETVEVKLPGGSLFINVSDNFKTIIMTGEAEFVFKGELN